MAREEKPLHGMTPPSYEDLFARNYGIFSEARQERLRRASVLIVGCGGIGGTVAIILARSGVGRFVLVDFDRYEPTNMNRQIACFADTLGRNKALVIGEQIEKINPEAVIEIHDRLLDHTRIASLIPGVDIVFRPPMILPSASWCSGMHRSLAGWRCWPFPPGPGRTSA